MMGNSIEVCVRSFDIRASNKWWGVKLTNGKNWWAPFPHQIAAAREEKMSRVLELFEDWR